MEVILNRPCDTRISDTSWWTPWFSSATWLDTRCPYHAWTQSRTSSALLISSCFVLSASYERSLRSRLQGLQGLVNPLPSWSLMYLFACCEVSPCSKTSWSLVFAWLTELSVGNSHTVFGCPELPWSEEYCGSTCSQYRQVSTSFAVCGIVVHTLSLDLGDCLLVDYWRKALLS